MESVTDSEHTVTAEVQELDDTGTPLIGKKTSGVKFYLADPALTPEIRDAWPKVEGRILVSFWRASRRRRSPGAEARPAPPHPQEEDGGTRWELERCCRGIACRLMVDC